MLNDEYGSELADINEWAGDNLQVIEEYVNRFNSPSTIRCARCHLNQFFEVIKKDPNTYIKEVRKMENGEKIDYTDSIENDVNNYWQWLIKTKKAAPKTVHNAISCVRTFLRDHRIRLDDIVWDNIRRRGIGNKPIMFEKPMTKQILKEILTHADAFERSMFLVWSSSGLRQKELLQLKMNDMDLEHDPVKIFVRHMGTPNQSVKTKYSRYCFISPEATHAVKEWFKIRTGRLKLAEKRTNFKNSQINLNDDRVFPINVGNMNKHWGKLLKKSGYAEKDERTGFFVYHSNTMRKFFRTNLGKFNRDLADFLMGHKHYLTENYLRMPEDDVATLYGEGVQQLMIYETSPDISGLHEEMNAVKRENIRMKQELHNVRNQISGFQNILDDPKLSKEFALKLLAIFEELKKNK